MKKMLCLLLTFVLMTVGGAFAENQPKGQAKGFGGTVTVTLTLEDGVIKDASIDAPDETPAIGGAALETLREQLIAAGSADIDGVSGATMTSSAVREAAKAALEGSASGSEGLSFVPGTYTGSARGMWSDITVEVTVSEDRITDVKVIECQDTPIAADSAAATVPARIVEEQSLAVDTATGATMTSNAILAAAKNAVAEAANNPGSLNRIPEKAEKKVLPDEEADIVIVGGGGAGMSAAAAAGKADPTLKILVLEKQSWVGGNTALSGSGIMIAGTEQNRTGEGLAWVVAKKGKPVDTTPEEAVAYYRHKTDTLTCRQPDQDINEQLVYRIFEKSSTYFPYLLSEGLQLGFAVIPGYYEEEGRGIMGMVQLDQSIGASRTWGDWLKELAVRNNAEIRVNSKVTALTGEGEVTGVVVETPDSIYTVKAKKVILATGGFAHNRDLLLEVSGMFENMDKTFSFAAAGSTGDALEFTKPFDAATTGYGVIAQFGHSPSWSHGGAYGDLCNDEYLDVNQNGERFLDENLWYYDKADIMLHMKDLKCYMIIPEIQAQSYEAVIQEALDRGWGFCGENADDLAVKAGMDPAALRQSIQEYADRIASGETNTYGLPFIEIDPDSKLYALEKEVSIIETMYGLKEDEHFRVLNTSGEPIRNLYAAGAVGLGNYMLEKYYATTNAVAIAVYGGALAGEEAVEAIHAGE